MGGDSPYAPLSSTERKILLIVIAAILATAVATFWIFYHYVNKGVSETVLERSDAIFSFLTSRIAPESLLELNKPEDKNNKLYTQTQDLLNNVRRVTAVRYLYTAKRDAAGTAIYVVDGLDESAEDFRRVSDPIEDEVLPMLSRCLEGTPAHEPQVLRTEWGDILPACTPILHNGQTVGAIVMEFDATLIARSIRNALSYSLLVSCVLVLAFTLITVWLLHRLSIPLYRKLAYTDLLTGINNRNAFELDVRRMFQRGEEDGQVVLACDLNMLKTVNDQRGHAAGDAYIRSLAGLLVERFRDRGTTYRIGGDEFATLLRHVDLDDLEKEMRDLHAKGLEINIEGFPLFFAYGMARFDPQCDADLHATLIRADARMYEHKRILKKQRGLEENEAAC